MPPLRSILWTTCLRIFLIKLEDNSTNLKLIKREEMKKVFTTKMGQDWKNSEDWHKNWFSNTKSKLILFSLILSVIDSLKILQLEDRHNRAFVTVERNDYRFLHSTLTDQ